MVITGRPRIYDYDHEAELLDKWSILETSLNLLEFANERNYPPQNLSEWASINEKFNEALKIAKSRIAVRREKLVHQNKFNYGIYNRSIGMYDPLLNTHEKEVKAYEASLKSQNDQSVRDYLIESINYAASKTKDTAST